MAGTATANNDAPWLAEGGEKRETVRRMFAEIAPRYDRLNALMSLRRHHVWRASAVRELDLKPGDAALDVCCGTGDFLVPLRRSVGPSGRTLGIDYCAPMLEIASKKLPGAHLALGDACRLPVASGRFDGVTVGWGLRNVPDLEAALREIARVLKPGGRMACLDMAIPRNPIARGASALVCGFLLPALGSLFGHRRAYTYLPKSAERFASREELAQAMQCAGFGEVRWRDFMFGNICLHVGVKR